MECEICYSSYDHSIHKPYMLSCPHTICISCVNQLTSNKCPTCNFAISIKNPNIQLLKLIPQSSYDLLKDSFQKTLNEISEIKNSVKNKGGLKLNKCLNEINSVRECIRNETSKFIQQVKSNETELLKELKEIEEYVKNKLQLPQLESVSRLLVFSRKLPVENNTLKEKDLADLIEGFIRLKKKLNKLENKIEVFNENIEFTVNTNHSIKDGIIGEILTNKKKFEKFTQLAKSSVDINLAIDFIDRAIEISPEKVNSFCFKAETLLSAGKFNASLKFYDKCIEEDPSEKQFYKKKVEILFGLKRYEEALEEINKSLELDSNDINSLNFKGRLLRKLEKYDEALIQFNEAIRLDPNDQEFNNYGEKGEIYMEIKNYKEALKWLNIALDLNPMRCENFVLKLKCLKKLNQLDEEIYLTFFPDTNTKP